MTTQELQPELMKTYLVGGAVRDTLLGRKVTERDYVVVGSTAEAMLAAGFAQVGKDFPVFLHPKSGEEYALARTERKAGVGYTGFVCDASSEVTLVQDLQRRDLTVNAMAMDEDGNLVDPYGGQRDLHHKILRHVSTAFGEDPLRVLRVARFAARYAHLGFTIADETLALMQQMANSGELANLSPERVWQETRRALMEQDPQIFWQTLLNANAMLDWFPELAEHTAQSATALNIAAQQEAELEVRWALLHAPLDDAQTRSLNQRLKTPNLCQWLAHCTSQWYRPIVAEQVSTVQWLALLDACDWWRQPERFELLLKTVDILVAPISTKHSVWQLRKNSLRVCLEQLNGINVQAIIERGFKGAEIRQQLTEQRQVIIAQTMAAQ